MKYEVLDGNLIIYVNGRIDSNTVSEFSGAVNEIIEKTEFETITLEFEAVEYISSVGLREILKLSKKYKVTVDNVSSEVYEIFDMTGFTTIIDVRKAKRRVDLSNATIIGKGCFSKVYRLTDDSIIKVYVNNTSIEEIDRERRMAREAFVQGVPTAIAFDVVKADDKYGLIFEAFNGGTLTEHINKDENKLDDYIKLYARFLKTVNSTKSGNSQLPDANKKALTKVEVIKDYIETDVYEAIKKITAGIKECDTYVHSDCHTGNIMLQDGELMLIDMDTISVGNPIFELVGIYCAYIAFEEYELGNNKRILGLETNVARRLFYDTMDLYFEGLSREEIDDNLKKISLMGYLHMLYWIRTYRPEAEQFFAFEYKRLKECLGEVSDANLKMPV